MESADMLRLIEAAFISSTLVYSFMHLFLSERSRFICRRVCIDYWLSSISICIIYVNIKIPSNRKQSNSEEIIDNSSVNSSFSLFKCWNVRFTILWNLIKVLFKHFKNVIR